MSTTLDLTPLYRSYLTLDLTSNVRAALTDVHRMHQLVFAGYHRHVAADDPQARSNLNLLYAVDSSQNGTVRLVTQATAEPEWDNPAITNSTKRVDRHTYTAGDTVAFQIAAAPTKSVATSHGKRGRRVPVPRAEYSEWIERKLSTAGLTDISAAIVDVSTYRSAHLTDRTKTRARTTKGHALTLVTFTGTATVEDRIHLRAAQATGIGTGKAHGAGLLLLR